MTSIVYPGQDDPDGYGRMLCECFGLMPLDTEPQINELRELIPNMKTLRDQLSNVIPLMQAALDEGVCGPADDLAVKASEWNTDWERLKSIVSNLGWTYELSSFSLANIEECLDHLSIENQQLTEAISKFDDIVKQCIENVEGQLIILQNDAALCNQLRVMLNHMNADRITAAGSKMTVEDCNEFKKLLLHYNALHQLGLYSHDLSIMSDPREWITDITSWFGIDFRSAMIISNTFASLGQMDDLDLQLNSIITRLNQKETDPLYKKENDDEVFSQLLKKYAANEDISSVPIHPLFPSSELETALVQADPKTAESLIIGDEALPEDRREEMLTALRDQCMSSFSVDPASAGRRLLTVLGNRDRLAEKYLLADLVYNQSSQPWVKGLLLDIYRREDRPEEFLYLVRGSNDADSLSAEDKRYYVKCLCDAADASVQTFVQNHYELLYDSTCNSFLRGVDASLWQPEFAAMLNAARLPDPASAQDDKVVLAVMNGSLDQLRDLLDAEDACPDLDQLKQLLDNRVSSDHWVGFTNDLAAARDLLEMLGTRGGLAERCLWNAMESKDAKQRSQTISMLLRLMTDEKRWNECLNLAAVTSDEAEPDFEARCGLLLAQLHINPSSAAEQTQESVHELLTLCARNSETQALVAQLAEKDKSGFFARVIPLFDCLDNVVYKGLILLGTFLHDISGNPELLRSLGFTEETENKINEWRRTNDYPKGMDALTIARRVYACVGVRDGVAERFARFALPNPDALELLRTILRQSQDSQALTELMLANESLRNDHPDEYCMLLVTQNYWTELADALQQYPVTTPNTMFIRELLAMHDNDVPSDAFDQCLACLMRANTDLLSRLTGQFGARNDTEHFLMLLEGNFHSMLNEWNIDTLTRVMTGGGTLSETFLADLQQAALAQDGNFLPAVFIFNILHVGEIQEIANRVYNNLIASLEHESAQNREQLLNILQKLYPSELESLKIQETMAHLARLAENGADSANELISLLTNELTVDKLDPAMFTNMLRMLPTQVLLDVRGIACARKWLANPAFIPDCLSVYHSAFSALPGGSQNSAAEQFLAELYLRALQGGFMPEDLYESAASQCLRFVRNDNTGTAMLCTYYLETALGHPKQAVFALYSALKSHPELSEDLSATPGIDDTLLAEPTTKLALFQQVLTTCQIENILRYCRFCGSFVDPAQAQTAADAVDPSEGVMMSVEKCDALLDRLYADPDNAATWSQCMDQLPLQGDPAVRACMKLVTCSISTPVEVVKYGNRETSIWWDCAEQCEASGDQKLLLTTLMKWSALGETQLAKLPNYYGSMLEICRSFVEDRLKEDHDYLNNLRDINAEDCRTLFRRLFLIIPNANRPAIGGQGPDAVNKSVFVNAFLVAGLNDEVILKEYIDQIRPAISLMPDRGVVLFAHLLLARRISEARELLTLLAPMLDRCRYGLLLGQLSEMDDETLDQWRSQFSGHSLLQLMLPDCSMPVPLTPLIEWAVRCIHEKLQKEGLKVIDKLCEIFPQERFYYRIKFIILKGMDGDHLEEIFETLKAMIAAPPQQSDDYDHRSMVDYALLMAGIRAVMIERSSRMDADSEPVNQYFRTHASSIANMNNDQNRILLWENELSDVFTNRSDEERRQLCHLITCWVTGNWETMVEEHLANPAGWAIASSLRFPMPSYGFSRSAILVLSRESDRTRRTEIGQDLKTYAAEHGENLKESVTLAINRINRIEDHASMSAMVDNICRYPLEEVCMTTAILNQLMTPDFLSDVSQAKTYATVALALAGSRKSMLSAYTKAQTAFEAHLERLPHVLFKALYNVASSFKILPNAAHTPTDPQLDHEKKYLDRWRYRYNNYALLIALMSEDEQLYSPELYSQLDKNYFNVSLLLLASNRANEMLLLRRRLPNERRDVINSLLDILQADTDTKRLEIALKQQPLIKIGLLFLLSRTPQNSQDRFITQTQSAARQASSLYTNEKGIHGNNASEPIFWNYLNIRFQLAKTQKVPQADDPDISLPTAQTSNAAEDVEMAGSFDGTELSHTEDPSEAAASRRAGFLSDLKDRLNMPPMANEECPESREELLQQYTQLDMLSLQDRLSQADISAKLYRMSLTDQDEKTQLDMAIQYVIDRFNSRSTHAQEDCDLLLLSALAAEFASPVQRNAFRTLVNQANQFSLRTVMGIEYADMSMLLSHFKQYRSGYDALKKNIDDANLLSIINKIYKELDNLERAYETLGLSDIDSRKEALAEANKKLSHIPYTRGLNGLTATIIRVIMKEFNQIDSQPHLEIRVLNEGPSQRRGRLFGEIVNTGRTEAREISLWGTFGESTVSSKYHLPVLAGGSKAVFDIEFKARIGDETLAYTVEATCMTVQGVRIECRSVTGEVTISNQGIPDFNVENMNNGTILHFALNGENNDVESKDFIGREPEKRRLRALYDNKSFAEIRNAMLVGIRRSGKTSLLNYLKTYLNLTRKDLRSVIVSGQSDHGIYGVMVKSVLMQLFASGSIPEETQLSLKEKWISDMGDNDIDPTMLPLFYSDVSAAMGGKGLVLVVDEFDRLLEKLAKRQSLESSFYPVLSSMLCDGDVAQHVHFLFCGSKELLFEKTNDRQNTQVFQRLNSDDIHIGAMPKDDMITMVTRPYEEYDFVKFTPAALDWLWSMTGGLIWFTKLVAKAALRQAQDENRSVVYPLDIYECACSIAQSDVQCKQCFEGFREDERLVVEALGHEAVRPNQFVSVKELTDVLRFQIDQGRITRERIERALQNMKDLEIIENTSQNPSAYRFCTEIYRRYFRHQTEYAHVLSTNDEQEVRLKIVFE